MSTVIYQEELAVLSKSRETGLTLRYNRRDLTETLSSISYLNGCQLTSFTMGWALHLLPALGFNKIQERAILLETTP